MKIKRYTAPSMRAALDLVRAEQGADAVILSSRRSDEGIEVIAAVDYDEGLFQDMNRQRLAAAADVPPPDEPPAAAPPGPAAPTRLAVPTRPAVPSRPAAQPVARMAVPPNARPAAPAAAPPPAPPMVRRAAPPATSPTAGTPAPAPASKHVPLARPAAPSGSAAAASKPAAPAVPVMPAAALPPAPHPGMQAVQRQLTDLTRMLESGLKDMSWNERRVREPLRARVLEDLSALDLAPDVALALAELAPRRTTAEDPLQLSLALLAKNLPIAEDLSELSSGIIAILGPTGAGKTTTLAKLAARWCMRHGSGDVALVSTDGYRIGARDQLMTYARILDVPMHAVNSGRDLARTLERLSRKKLVLIDTAGMGPRDVRLSEQLAALELGATRARMLLALPAQGEAQSLDEIVRAYARAKPVACILTKVDEAASLGAVISATVRHRLAIAYLCNGQRVPDDLHAAHRRRVWLARMALKLKEGRPAARDPAYLARHFGGAALNA